VNLERDSDRLGHFSIVVRPSGRRRARCEASTTLTGGAGASRPVSFFGTAIGVWCPATTRFPSGSCAVSLPSPSARRSSGRHERIVAGAERSLSYETRLSSDLRGVRHLVPTAREAVSVRAEGPRRGTKPREGRDAARSATVAVVIRTRRRSNAPKSALRGGGIARCSLATVDAVGSGPRDGERQGGNGHGDVVRLPARIPSRGVKRAARTASPPPTAIGSPMSGSGTG
jgi:hypothetical protein